MKNRPNKLLAVSLGALLFASGCEEPSMQEQMTKTWRLVQVFEAGIDRSIESNPRRNRILVLDANGEYASTGSPYPPKSGVWTLDMEKKTLFMDSNAGPGDDTNWKVEIKGDTLICSGNTPTLKGIVAKWVPLKEGETL